MNRPAEHYVHGAGAGTVVVVPARVAALLERYAGLADFRIKTRGRDGELDHVLVALHYAALSWREASSARSGTPNPEPPEPARESRWMTTAQVASRLGITSRAVRKAISDGRLHGELDGSSWRINAEDFAHYRATRTR